MFAFGIFFIVLCFGFSPVWSDTDSISASIATPVEGVLHRWCTSTGQGRFPSPSVPPQCCTDQYKCDKFIEGHTTKYGLENTGPLTKRHCKCDRAFAKCVFDNPLSLLQVATARMSFYREYCFRKNKSCTDDGSSSTCNKNIFLETGSIVSENPK